MTPGLLNIVRRYGTLIGFAAVVVYFWILTLVIGRRIGHVFILTSDLVEIWMDQQVFLVGEFQNAA